VKASYEFIHRPSAIPLHRGGRLRIRVASLKAFIGLHGCKDLGLAPVLIDQQLSGAVYVDVLDHRLERRHPAARASASVQNHRSPLEVVILVLCNTGPQACEIANQSSLRKFDYVPAIAEC
jgi:hypothetical protein